MVFCLGKGLVSLILQINAERKGGEYLLLDKRCN